MELPEATLNHIFEKNKIPRLFHTEPSLTLNGWKVAHETDATNLFFYACDYYSFPVTILLDSTMYLGSFSLVSSISNEVTVQTFHRL